ncbi:hypothetical protein BDV26DRAFT_16203 [Aspergillus bertholletiae]|uniref:Uncharacterized protein n=1 Tax=Aspergillus bertholletiae TaxID=1226010 RepID=A0A5N7BKQ0_9EURO|nr:hypothetical protein BDV26DRAFT_16203 [Aspergillus bertholletiae]
MNRHGDDASGIILSSQLRTTLPIRISCHDRLRRDSWLGQNPDRNYYGAEWSAMTIDPCTLLTIFVFIVEKIRQNQILERWHPSKGKSIRLASVPMDPARLLWFSTGSASIRPYDYFEATSTQPFNESNFVQDADAVSCALGIPWRY